MSVGVLAHLFGSLPYKELAPKVAESGFKHVQLALWKAISDINFSKPGNLSPGLANAVGEQFDKHGVSISVLGCYVHLFDRNEEQRRANVNRFKELLRYAKFFGAPMVAAETGRNEGNDYTDRDWSIMRVTLEELVEEAEKWGVFVGLEAANDHLIGTAPELARILKEVPSSNVGVVIDPGNLLTADNFARQNEVIGEAFELLGSRIIAAHAKDRMLLDDGSLGVVPAGFGTMNYELYMKLLNQYKPHVHIIMEEAKEYQMAQAKGFIEEIRGRV
ncbi:sugar phosphate isomerase/epimerase [Paenibacillus alkaliterrae]|uniref:sugar phosphate isomerase/epimerase family protein n=1 Tax=Paenibacillus alkaliterrae TaxID=320909 RepID=UPI001F16C0CE|nr:sugar phosphate isomerase/epimerase [Paenibacillus alkaliterrae]MCF2938150.1 sugar phosphate isomerase/epimerase [Paenibacillus alkaliterrae]